MIKTGQKISDDLGSIYQCALGLLARREHSAQELTQKLRQRYSTNLEGITEVLLRLQQEGYQSDSRFAEIYIRSRVNKGFGRVRIARELAAKGMGRSEIAEAIEQAEPNLNDDCIRQLWQKKFGQLPQSPPEKYKQMQFLMYRGFAAEEIAELFQALQVSDN